jgi:hypothetical protein
MAEENVHMPLELDRELAQKLLRKVDLQMNQDALVAAKAHVSSIKLAPAGNRHDDVLLPWYMRDGLPVGGLPRHGDRPITLGEASAPGFCHPRLNKEKLEKHWPGGPVRLSLPAYKVSQGHLLLNGSHRSIGTLRAAVPYDIELEVIQGPIEGTIIADLAVFA